MIHKCNSVHLHCSISDISYFQSFKMDCCLTNDDAFVVGGSEDGYVFFWELVDAPVVARFRAHSSVVFFFPELKTLCFFAATADLILGIICFQFWCSLFSLLS